MFFLKLIESFVRACKNGFKGFIEWIRSLLKTEGKHLDEVLDEVERISLKNYSKTEILALLIQDNINKFYNPTHLEAIYKKALQLDMSLEDLRGFVKTGNIKEIKSVELLKQMDNYINIVLKRGYPFGFRNLKEFEQFCDILKSELSSIGLSTNDIRIQGSSLRKLKPKDLDLAVFIDDSNFNNLLRNAFEGKIKLNGKIVDISIMSDNELMNLSENIFNNDKTNAVSRTFARSFIDRKISSKTKHPPIFKYGNLLKKKLNEKYKQLNIEDISIQTKGGKLELKPDLKIK